jgi:TRAP-type uncharacterized transport system substrate-binding protein
MTYIRYLTLAAAALCLFANDAVAQTAPRAPQQAPRAPQQPPRAAPQQTSPAPAPQQTPASALPGADDVWTIPDRDRINEGTVTVITAPAGGATAIFGSDMARVLDDDASVRVLPVLGKGPVRNVVDILHLKSIDMGAVAADVPEFYKLQYKIPDIQSRLRYIAKLYHNELHIVAPKSIKSIFDLNGKRIVAQTDVGYYTAKVVFARLGIKAASFDFRTDDARAIQKIEDGEADAYITSTGKVFPLGRAIKNESRALHLVPVPYDRRLQDMYLPTTFSAEEYPNLLDPGQTIDTIATSVLLVAFNWPENSERYIRVARFVDTFFSRIEEFHKPPRHPKWKEASISLTIPGWQRFKAADDWLARHRSPSPEAERGLFEQFLADNGVVVGDDPARREALFRQFMEWQKRERR